MIIIHGRGWFIVGPSPSFDLIGPKLFDDFLLVFTDQIPVIPFVESPVLVDGNVLLTQLHEGQIGRPDGPTKQTRVDFVETNPRLFHHLTRDTCLQYTIFGQRRIRPTNKDIV